MRLVTFTCAGTGEPLPVDADKVITFNAKTVEGNGQIIGTEIYLPEGIVACVKETCAEVEEMIE